MAKNKILEILERIDVEKVGNETLKKKIIELKDDVKDLDDSDFSKSKEAEETEKAYIKNANTIISLVEKTSPAALSAKAVVTRKPKEERPKAPEKKVEPKPEPKKEPEKKPEAKKPEPKKEEKKPMKVVVKPKAKKEPEKKYKITPKAKKAAEEKPEAKKEIEVKVKPTDELSNVRDILEEANYTVIVKKVGKTTVKRKAPRQDRTIVKDKVEDVFTTIQKDIPKEKDGKQVEKVTEKLKAIFTKILVAIDKLTTSGNLSQLQKLEAFLKKLVEKEKFEDGGGVDGEKKKYEITFIDDFSSATQIKEAFLTDSQYQKALQQMADKDIVVSRFDKATQIHENLRIQDIKPLENVEFAKGGGVDGGKKKYEIELFWKQLKDDRRIGKYVVTEKTLERIDEEWAHIINIDVIDESDKQPISEFDLKKILFAKGRERYLFAKGGDIDKEIDDIMNLPTDEYFWKYFDGHEIRSIKYEGIVYVNGKDKTIKVLGKTIKPSLSDIKELMDEAFYEEFGYRNANELIKATEEFAKGGGVGGEIKDIAKFKQNLIQKAKQKGLYEDFGQDEVRKLTDKYGYTSNVAAFDNWAMNFDLSQL